MKRQFMYVILTAGLSALFGSPTLSAQDQMEIANVPFAFQVNDAVLAAGKYQVSRDISSGLIQMRNSNTGHGIYVMTHPTDYSRVNNPRLTFTCYGNDCVLSTIWMSDEVGYGAFGPAHDHLTRKIGLSANLRFIRLEAR